MKRTDKYPDTKTFHYHNENPKNRITGDCTFRAIATVTGKSWADVVMEMAQLSVETGYAINDKKGIRRYMESLGWVKRKQPRKDDNTKYTGREFCELQQKYLNTGVKVIDGIDINPCILANIGGEHIVAIIDGKVNDIWNSTGKCIGNYWVKL